MASTRSHVWVALARLLFTLLWLLGLCTPITEAARAAAAIPEAASVAPRGVDLASKLTVPLRTSPGRVSPGAPDAQSSSAESPQQTPIEQSQSRPLWLRVTVDPPEVQAGELVTVTVQVAPDVNLAEALVTSALPAELSVDSLSGEGARYVPEEHRIYWPLPVLAAGSAAQLQMRLLVREDAPDVMVARVELRAGDLSLSERAVIRRSFPPSEVRVSPDGGEVRSADGRVRLLFPAEAVTQTVRVTHRPLSVEPLLAQQAGIALKFELNAATDDESATRVRQFARRLTITVDLAGLVNWEAMPFYQHPFLGYWDEDQEHWVPIPAHREGDLLVGTLDHLSILGGGSGNQYDTGWVLPFNDAHVNAFNGGFSYDYPIQVPEGRGGLTPDLHLSYNSRRVDGILTWIQTDWVGLGWTLDTMEIVRWIRPLQWPPNGFNIEWRNEFTLLYKGTGYKLKPDTGGLACGRYRAEDEQFLYIERRNVPGGNASPNNTTGEYWIVRLRDGTEYRLGYNENSEQTIIAYPDHPTPNADCVNFWTTTTEPCYASRVQHVLTFRWRVDLIRDLRGNNIEFSYSEMAPYGLPDWERASYLSQVRYNNDPGGFGTHINFVRAQRGSDYEPADGDFPRFFAQQDYLSSIRVQNWNGSTHRIIREYVLDYTESSPLPPEHDNHTRLLASITEYGLDGVGGNHALPPTTFSYSRYPNKGWCAPSNPPCSDGVNDQWDQESFRYERLTEIHNGYGGAIWAGYDTPDGGWWQAFNYRIGGKDVHDGQGGGCKTVYSYAPGVADRGYDNNDVYGCEYFQPGDDTGGSLVGYRFVTETLKTIGDAPISITAREFKLNSEADPDRRLGRELWACYKDAEGNGLKKVVTQWVSDSIISGVYFVHPTQVDEYIREGSGLPSVPQKKTLYSYDPEQQNGTQCGNVTGVEESMRHGSGPYYHTLYRETQHSFWPNTTAWIVDLTGLTVVYDGAGAVQSKTAFLYDGNTIYDSMPTRGNLTKLARIQTISPPAWVTVQTITYSNSYSMPVQIADGNGNVTRTEYDWAWLRPLTVINALGQSTSYEYDSALWKVTRVQGPNGADTATSYEYDYWGRLTKIIRPGDSSTYPTVQYVYDDASSPLRIATWERVTAGQGTAIPTFRFYNGLGQLIQENKGTSDQTQMTVANWTYNAQGLKEREYVPCLAAFTSGYVGPMGTFCTTYTYDALGRPTSVTNADGTAVRTAYDGFRKAVLDENNHQRIYESDYFGRLSLVKEFQGSYGSFDWGAEPYASTGYKYNALDLLTSVTDAVGNETAIAYDPMGRKTAMSDPDMGTWTYTYDNAGNLKSQTDARSQRICFYYDALNRLVGKWLCVTACTCPSTPPILQITYGYDSQAGGNKGIGYRTRMGDLSGSTSWKYDARGRVISQTNTVSGGTFNTQWTYNSRDQVVTQTYPGGNGGQLGEVVTTGYDAWSRPASLSGSSVYVLPTPGAAYDVLGRLDFLPLLNDRQVDLVYYDFGTQGGRVHQIKAGTSGQPTSDQNLEYSYDNAGNVSSIKDYNNSGQIQSFIYDDLDRLTWAYTGGGGADTYDKTYAYDVIGNLTRMEDSGIVTRYDYPCWRHKVAAVDRAQKYWYDANGNMTKRVVGGTTYNLSYDVENHLTGVSGGASASFEYDGDGKRARGTVNSVTTAYVGNWYEWRSSAQVSYYYLGSRRVAMRTSSQPNADYLYVDHLGSTTNTAGASGTSLQRYYPYGARRGASEVLTPYRFTGQREESALGLYYYGARWYDPALGRFIQPDPLVPEPGNPQALNRYSYALNNPLRYTDASGHYVFEEQPGDPWVYDLDPRVRSQYWYTQPGPELRPVSWGDALLVPLLPFVAAAGLAVVPEVATVIVDAAIAKITSVTLAGAAQAACADGDCTNEVRAAAQGLDAFSRAADFGIQSYGKLTQELAGTGLEAHHLVEVRFAETLELIKQQIPSIALTPQEHQLFTNYWRQLIGYANSGRELTTLTARLPQVWDAAQRIYSGYPELLEAVRKALFGQ